MIVVNIPNEQDFTVYLILLRLMKMANLYAYYNYIFQYNIIIIIIIQGMNNQIMETNVTLIT